MALRTIGRLSIANDWDGGAPTEVANGSGEDQKGRINSNKVIFT